MTKRGKTLLLTLSAVLLLAALAAPTAIRLGTVHWTRSKARRMYASFAQDAQATSNHSHADHPSPAALPVPSPPSNPRASSFECLRRSPANPRSCAMHRQTVTNLGYPQFTVTILEPFSTAPADALMGADYHQDSFEHQVETYRVRPADLDAQPDLAAIKHLVELLSDETHPRCPLDLLRPVPAARPPRLHHGHLARPPSLHSAEI